MLNIFTIAVSSWIVHEAGVYGWGGSIALGVLFWLAGNFVAGFFKRC